MSTEKQNISCLFDTLSVENQKLLNMTFTINITLCGSINLSAIHNFVGVYSLKGITAVASIHAVFPKDVAIFIHKRLDKETWYAAALECRDRKQANDLVIYKHIVSTIPR